MTNKTIMFKSTNYITSTHLPVGNANLGVYLGSKPGSEARNTLYKNQLHINLQLSYDVNEVTVCDPLTGCSQKANIEMKAFIFEPTNLN